MQKRAKKGGEIGLNGEWYPAGSFICTTDLAIFARSEKKKQRKVQIGPKEWAVPEEGKEPLFIGAVGGVFCEHRSADSVNDTALAYLGLTRKELEERRKRFLAGERWL